jgi:hypothetical protein
MIFENTSTHQTPPNESGEAPNPEPLRRKRGGQAGNQNARKHGFYAQYHRCLRETKEARIRKVRAMPAIDREIAEARAKLADIVSKTPYNYRVFLLAVASLGRLVSEREKLDRGQLNDKLRRILADLPVSAELEAAGLNVAAAGLTFVSNIESHEGPKAEENDSY